MESLCFALFSLPKRQDRAMAFFVFYQRWKRLLSVCLSCCIARGHLTRGFSTIRSCRPTWRTFPEQTVVVRSLHRKQHCHQQLPSSRLVVHLSTSNDDATAASTFSPTTTCQFSKFFPKYRIYLSSVEEEKRGVFSWPASFTRSKLERSSDNLRWFDDVADNVQTLATLWRVASDCLAQDKAASVTAAFPKGNVKTVRRFVDLFEWLMDYEASCVQIAFQQVDSVPTITVTESSAKAGLEREEEQGLLVTTNDQASAASIIKRTKSWVRRILVDQGICPFTKSTKLSGQGLADVGVPVGSIAYHTSTASPQTISELQADAWEAIYAMLQAGPAGKSGISSILLAAPAFDHDFDLWAGPVFCLLENGVLVADATDKVGVVCFHPEYRTPDGASFPGFGHMHSVPRLEKWFAETDTSERDLSSHEIAAGGSWQRRTPHATINVLRADQLAAAERRRSTPALYSENIRKLVDGIGLEKLQNDLDSERCLN
jgi:hypothetical protein